MVVDDDDGCSERDGWNGRKGMLKCVLICAG